MQYIIHCVQVESTDRVAEAKEEPIEVKVEEVAPVATAVDVSKPEQKVMKTISKSQVFGEKIYFMISLNPYLTSLIQYLLSSLT